MSFITRLRDASARLGPDKWKRASAVLRNYGLREFVRRGAAKLRGSSETEMDGGRRLVVTNESYYPNGRAGSFEVRSEVVFETAPSRDNITQVAVRTRCKRPGPGTRLHLQVSDGDKILASSVSGNVQDNSETVIRFPVVRGVFGKVLRFTLRTEGEDSGILVNPQKEKDGFRVEGGGSIACRVYGMQGDDPYEEWITWNQPSEADLEAQRNMPADVEVAVCFEMKSGAAHELEAFMQSLRSQTYSGWHAYILCPPDDAVSAEEILDLTSGRETLIAEEGEFPAAFSGRVEEPYAAFAENGVVLEPHALAEIVPVLQSADFVYADEDVLGAEGRRKAPFFKPDYSPNYLLSFNYIGPFIAASRSALSGIRARSMYDLVLQISDGASRIAHVPDVLYHVLDSPRASIDPEDLPAVQSAMERRGITASIHRDEKLDRFEADYALPDPAPKVSILIPSHDGADMLRECITSILEKSTYPNYEIVIIENNSTQPETFSYYEEATQDSRVRLLTWNHPFNFAAINNWAAERTDTDLLLFLNNDTSVISPDWMERMAALASRRDVGAVGAKLLYPDDTVQHGGVVMRMMGIASHAHLGQPADAFGSFGRLKLPFDVSGATGACLMIPKDVFQEVGGFDEQYVLAFNDVDICLKIRDLGLSILMEPRAELYHFESKTRGYEVTLEQQKRFRNEQIIWIRKWRDKYPGDPFYNPNLRYDTCSFDTAPEKRGASAKRVSKPYDDLIDAQLEP